MSVDKPPTGVTQEFTPVVEVPRGKKLPRIYDPTDDDGADSDLVPRPTSNSRNWMLVKGQKQPKPDEDVRDEKPIAVTKLTAFEEPTSRRETIYYPCPQTDKPAETKPESVPTSNQESSASPSAPVTTNRHWLEVLNNHSDGQSNLNNLHAEFGQRLADTVIDLDDFQGGRFRGKYHIISGYRSSEKQADLYKDYGIYVNGVRVGETHMVARPGMSLHEVGCAVDIEFTGNKKDTADFFNTLHQIEGRRGLRSLKGDINHCELDDQSLIAELRHNKVNNTQLSSGKKPAHELPVFST